MGTFIEALPGRAEYEINQVDMSQDGWGIQIGTGGDGFFLVTLYVPVELRGVTPLTLRAMFGTIEAAGYTDFDVIVYGMDEFAEIYTGVQTWDDERWTWSGGGSAVGGETLWTAYRDFDISAAITPDTSHVIIGFIRLDPIGGLTDDVFFMNARTLE